MISSGHAPQLEEPAQAAPAHGLEVGENLIGGRLVADVLQDRFKVAQERIDLLRAVAEDALRDTLQQAKIFGRPGSGPLWFAAKKRK